MPWKEQTLVSVREEFVLKALEPDANLAALCREFGVSRKTGYKWVERYKSGGVIALRDLSRRPQSSPLGVSPEVVAEVVAVRNAHPRWGARKLLWALERTGVRPVPSERTVNRILERCGLLVKRRLRPPRLPQPGKPDVRADKSNALWTADYKGWWRTGDRGRCEPLTVRDQFSRFVLAVHVCRSPQIEEAMDLFDRLFELYGLPERILTDNGNPFVATQSKFGLTRLSAWWLSLGIEPLRSRVGTPSDNGGHERMHRDIAGEVEAAAAANAELQQRNCDLWRADFNNGRPHEALGMKTPSQVYRPDCSTYAGKKVELVYPERMLVRTVAGSGFFKYKGQMIPISAALAGYTIAVDPRTDEVWFAHRKLGVISLDGPRPTIHVPDPIAVSLNDLNHGDTILVTSPNSETTPVLT
jgi:transposase InsO family protein